MHTVNCLRAPPLLRELPHPPCTAFPTAHHHLSLTPTSQPKQVLRGMDLYVGAGGLGFLDHVSQLPDGMPDPNGWVTSAVPVAAARPCAPLPTTPTPRDHQELGLLSPHSCWACCPCCACLPRCLRVHLLTPAALPPRLLPAGFRPAPTGRVTMKPTWRRPSRPTTSTHTCVGRSAELAVGWLLARVGLLPNTPLRPVALHLAMAIARPTSPASKAVVSPTCPVPFGGCPPLMSALQVCTSGTDEHLELCKATYELYHELKMNAPGQPPLVRPPACIMCTPRQCSGDALPCAALHRVAACMNRGAVLIFDCIPCPRLLCSHGTASALTSAATTTRCWPGRAAQRVPPCEWVASQVVQPAAN